MRKLSNPEITDLKPTTRPVKTKDAPKKFKPTPNDNSTKQSPSYFEHVNTYILDSPISQSKRSSFKGVCISKPSSSPPLPPLPIMIHIEEILIFMCKYIDWIIDAKGDGNCGYRVVSTLLGNREENHTLIRQYLIKELKAHRKSYSTLQEIISFQ